MGVSRQEYWSGLLFLSPGDLLYMGAHVIGLTSRERGGLEMEFNDMGNDSVNCACIMKPE